MPEIICDTNNTNTASTNAITALRTATGLPVRKGCSSATALSHVAIYQPGSKERSNPVIVGSTFKLLEGAFFTLAGRFSSCLGLFSAQANALIGMNDEEYAFMKDTVNNHLDLECSTGNDNPTIVTGSETELQITTRKGGNRYRVRQEYGRLTAEPFARWYAFSQLLTDIRDIGFEWYDLVGTKANGYMAENLEVVLKAISKAGVNKPLFLSDLADCTGGINAVQDLCSRLAKKEEADGVELIQYEKYHGGYSLQGNVSDQLKFLQENWTALASGETTLLGWLGSEAEGTQTEEGFLFAIDVYESFAESTFPKTESQEDYFEFNIDDLEAHAKLMGLDSDQVNRDDLRYLLTKMEQQHRGANLARIDLEPRVPGTRMPAKEMYRKKIYQSRTRKVIPILPAWSLLYDKFTLTGQEQDWETFIEGIAENPSYNRTQKILLTLFDRFPVGKFELTDLKQVLSTFVSNTNLESYERGFRTNHLTSNDPQNANKTTVSVSSAEQLSTIRQIINAIDKCHETYATLIKDPTLIREMYQNNELEIGNPRRGEKLDMHKLREQSAVVLLDYLKRLRARN